MARTLAALAALATGASAQLTLERDLTGYHFEHYVQEFGKEYHPEELAKRQRIFAVNLERIRAHNSKPNKTWFAAVNDFTDWTPEEFRHKRLGGTRPIKTGFMEAPPARDLSELPASVDWRTKSGVVTAVKDQGGCGSCWAFSAVETFESHLAIATGKPAPVLSEQQVVSCTPNPQKCGGTGGCAGATQWLAFNYTKVAGLGLESAYPYQGITGTCDASKVKPVAINSGYVQLKSNSYTDLLNAVATVGPVSISVAAGAFQLYGGGILSADSCDWDVDHGVVLVGYGSEQGSDYWIIRNSWGPGWGEGGYIRVARNGEGKEPCGVDKTPQDGSACAGDTAPKTYCGVCALLSDSSYPTGLKSLQSEVVV